MCQELLRIPGKGIRMSQKLFRIPGNGIKMSQELFRIPGKEIRMSQELLRFSGKGNLKASAQHLTRQDHRRPPQRCGPRPCHVSTPRLPTSGEQGTFQVMGKPRQQCWGFSRLGGWGYAARKVGEVYFQIRRRAWANGGVTCFATELQALRKR